MKYWILPALIIFVVLGMAEFVTLQKITVLRTQNAALMKDAAEKEILLHKNENLDSLQHQNEQVATLRAANKDLPRLRNEIGQLRRQVAEMTTLRTENERLTKTAVAKSDQRRQNIFDIQYKKEALRDMGLGMPIDTLQTMLAAATQTNIDRALQCMSPEIRAQILGTNSLEIVQQQMAEEMKDFEGYQITDRQQPSPDEVILQVHMFGNVKGNDQHVENIHFKRFGNDWQMTQ